MPPQQRTGITQKQQRQDISDDDDTAVADVLAFPEEEAEDCRFQTFPSDSHTTPLRLSLTQTLPLLMFLDMLGVSLVVPLLNQYYVEAGIHHPHTREWLSLLFSTSQIVGGMVLSYLTDALHVSKKRLLQGTFIGACTSYALIGMGRTTVSALVCSRILVGLFKHSWTVSISLLTQTTTSHERSVHVGNLSAASTIAWIVGPSLGALLYQLLHPYAPPLCACGLFALNWGLATVLLPQQQDKDESTTPTTMSHDSVERQNEENDTEISTSSRSIAHKLGACFGSNALGLVVVVKLLVIWVQRATNYNLFRFFETVYGLESHQRGYISSYQQLLQFVVASLLVNRLLRHLGGERPTAVACCVIMGVTVALETRQSLFLFLTVICPLSSLSVSMLQLCLQTLVTQVAPKGTVFSVVAALDILQNIVSVTVPFYRTQLIDWTALPSTTNADDPDPTAWFLASSLHWAVLSLVAAWCLLIRWPPSAIKHTDSAFKKNR